MARNTLLLTILVLFLSSCGEYQKVLKSTDAEYKYTRAKEYLQAEKFMKASTLFEELVPTYKGTERHEEAIYLLAKSYFGQNDYLLAAHYFSQISRYFSDGPYTEEAYFMRAYCNYMDAPDSKLDQENSKKGIEAFEIFMNLYPNSNRVDEAQEYIYDLQEKIVYKDYLSARLYFDLGNYLGNNYQSAVIAAQNCLKDYPDTKYKEELSFLILESLYIQAVNSIQAKKEVRIRETIDEYHSFKNDFPESKFEKDADKIFKHSSGLLSNI